VTAADFRSLATEAAERTNLVVTRTFSKIYSLASLRVGYAVAHPRTIAEMRRAQAPFTVTQVRQAGAVASLGVAGGVAARVEDNARGRRFILDTPEDLEIPTPPRRRTSCGFGPRQQIHEATTYAPGSSSVHS